MLRQNEWASTQKYERHLKRLTKLRLEQSAPNIKLSTRMNSLSKERTGKKIKTETPNQNKVKNKQNSVSIRKLPVLLPLVSKRQRQLLGQYLSTTNIPNRQTEIVLQNYLLSRRIIGTKPCIDTSKFDKDFRLHEKYSHMRSRSKLQAISMSQSRLLKYKQFQISQKKRLHDKFQSIQGHGKFIFTLKIIKIQKIIKSRSEQCMYTVKIHFAKHMYQFQHVKTLVDSFSFNFRKKDAKIPCNILVQISEIIQMEWRQLGCFTIDVTDMLQHLSSSNNILEFNFEKQELQNMHSKRNGKIVGTINFAYNVRRSTSSIATDKSVSPLP